MYEFYVDMKFVTEEIDPDLKDFVILSWSQVFCVKNFNKILKQIFILSLVPWDVTVELLESYICLALHTTDPALYPLDRAPSHKALAVMKPIVRPDMKSLGVHQMPPSTSSASGMSS